MELTEHRWVWAREKFRFPNQKHPIKGWRLTVAALLFSLSQSADIYWQSLDRRLAEGKAMVTCGIGQRPCAQAALMHAIAATSDHPLLPDPTLSWLAPKRPGSIEHKDLAARFPRS